jgi:hypothetical protein
MNTDKYPKFKPLMFTHWTLMNVTIFKNLKEGSISDPLVWISG